MTPVRLLKSYDGSRPRLLTWSDVGNTNIAPAVPKPITGLDTESGRKDHAMKLRPHYPVRLGLEDPFRHVPGGLVEAEHENIQ